MQLPDSLEITRILNIFLALEITAEAKLYPQHFSEEKARHFSIFTRKSYYH